MRMRPLRITASGKEETGRHLPSVGRPCTRNLDDKMLQYRSMCDADYVRIFNGLKASSREITRLCGYSRGKFHSTRNTLSARFVTDASNSESGFSALFVKDNLITRMRYHEEVSFRRRDLQEYATDLLSESLVTGVPSIVKAPNWPRKLFKLCALLFCIAGFLYQTTEFLSYVLTYPSAVDIEVETPPEIPSPALTICDNNGIQRSKFCKKYPEKCEAWDNKTEFCLNHSGNCDKTADWKSFMVPKLEYYTFEDHATMQDFRDLSVEQESFLQVIGDRSEVAIQGPFVLFKKKKLGTVCYTVNSCVNSNSCPQKINVTGGVVGRLRNPKMTVLLTFDDTELFLPGRDTGGWISLHSPFETSNPYYQGYFLRPHRRYSVMFRLEMEKLLPYPYSRNCSNYAHNRINGRRGPTSKGVCKELCDLRVTKATCNNCSGKSVDYPLYGDVCFLDCPGNYSYEDYIKCAADCTEDCTKYKYPYTVEGRPLHEMRETDYCGIILGGCGNNRLQTPSTLSGN